MFYYHVCDGAQLTCNMGDCPSNLYVPPRRSWLIDGKNIANIMDHKSMFNIKPFGLCHSLANPTVAAATAANWGILRPMPCIPNTITPWINAKHNIKDFGFPTLMKYSKLMCVWAGTIEVVNENNHSIGGR